MEQPFRVLKRQLSYVKIRYRGLKKNTAQLSTLFALSNYFDGAQQVDASRNMNAPEIRTRAVFRQKKALTHKKRDL